MIYADSLFALNMAIDYFLLLCSARLCGAGLRRARFALAAALGGAYALLCVLPGAGFLGCLISSLAGAKGWDALFLAVSAVMTACAAACFAIRRDFYTEKR